MCVRLCFWFQQLMVWDHGILDHVWFPAEALFCLSGYMSSQNMHFWSSENSHTVCEKPLHALKTVMQFAVSKTWIIWLISFDCIVNTAVCRTKNTVIRRMQPFLHTLYSLYLPVWRIVSSCAWTPGATTFITLCDETQFHKALGTGMYIQHLITIGT